MTAADRLAQALRSIRDWPARDGSMLDGAKQVAAEALAAHDAAQASAEGDEHPAELVCAQAYQVVGSLLSDVGQFGTELADKILDNLSEARIVHDDVLPWPSFANVQPKAAEGGAPDWRRTAEELFAFLACVKDVGCTTHDKDGRETPNKRLMDRLHGELGDLLYGKLNVQPTAEDDRVAFRQYLAECDDCAIVPDVAGAFNWAWQRASKHQPKDTEEAEPISRQYLREQVDRQMAGVRAALAAPSPAPEGKNWHARHVAVGNAALQMVRNALRTDAEAGKIVRAEMLEELDKATFAVPCAAPAHAEPARVTAYNVGRWCKSEDECIAAGIDFSAYERGVADAADAFAANGTASPAPDVLREALRQTRSSILGWQPDEPSPMRQQMALALRRINEALVAPSPAPVDEGLEALRKMLQAEVDRLIAAPAVGVVPPIKVEDVRAYMDENGCSFTEAKVALRKATSRPPVQHTAPQQGEN